MELIARSRVNTGSIEAMIEVDMTVESPLAMTAD